MGEGGARAPKKKQRVEVVVPPRPRKAAPQAARHVEPELDIVLALVNINNSVAALARAVTTSNLHLATIARYVEVLAGEGLEDSDGESVRWQSARTW
jgi:hypothetical protein